MITKERKRPAQYVTTSELWAYGSKQSSSRSLIPGSQDKIEYDGGPKTAGSHYCWKRCNHIWSGSDLPGPFLSFRSGAYTTKTWLAAPDPPSTKPPEVSQEMLEEGCRKLQDQVDLNCNDGVLLYSGILQAVPLVGGALRFNSLMRNLVSSLKRDMLRKPFTTVIKSAISLDFIDRFVVKPTIDDARKFLDASNYCLRVINTAYERNAAFGGTALESSVSHVDEMSKSQFDAAGFRGDYVVERSATAKVFCLADVAYNTDSIDPIKLWARRVGLTTPLESAWDLVPFSFVVDYFTRAGDFISELSNSVTSQAGLRGRVLNVRGLWACTEAKSVATYDAKDHGAKGSGFSDVQFTGGKVRAGVKTFSRFPLPASMVMSSLLAPERGLIHCDLSTRRAGTLAELFIQAKL